MGDDRSKWEGLGQKGWWEQGSCLPTLGGEGRPRPPLTFSRHKTSRGCRRGR